MNKLLFTISLLLVSSASAEFVFGPEVRIDMHPEGLIDGHGTDVVRRNDGRFCVVWNGRNSDPAKYRVWSSYSDDFGSTWSYPTHISDSECYSPSLVTIVADSLGTLYTTWQDSRGAEPYASYFSRSLDGGETWLWPNVKVTDDGQVGTGSGIAVNFDGTRLVSVFNRLTETRIYSSYSIDGGLTWSEDIPVGDNTPAGQYYVVIENTGSNSFVAIWNDKRDTESYVYCSISEDGGETWLSPNVPLPSGEGYGLCPYGLDLHWDGSILHAYWISLGWDNDFQINEVLYSRSSDGGYTWLDEPVRIDDGTLNTMRRNGGVWAKNPGTIYITWCSIWNSSWPIYAVCSVSSDSGQTWSDTLRANPVGGDAYRCEIFGDADTGEILVTWNNQLNQFIECAHGYDNAGVEVEVLDSGLLISRNPFSGAVLFTVTGDVIPEELSVYDSAGRVIASLNHSENGSFTWTPSENDPPGIYFARGVAENELLSAKVIRL